MTEEEDCEGLIYLRWSQFDSPDAPGSGKRFMERETVLVLDSVVNKTKMVLNIELGYTSKRRADFLGLVSHSGHRVGNAVRIRVKHPKKRGRLVKSLHEHGVQRIAISRESVYFDTDDQKPEMLALW